MKLYHVSPIENEESIIENGLYPNSTSRPTCKAGAGDTLQGENMTGIYGFAALWDAEGFAIDNQGMEANVIVAFDVPEGCEVLDDPEYDGQAFFVVTGEPVEVEKIA